MMVRTFPALHDNSKTATIFYNGKPVIVDPDFMEDKEEPDNLFKLSASEFLEKEAQALTAMFNELTEKNAYRNLFHIFRKDDRLVYFGIFAMMLGMWMSIPSIFSSNN